ncbi:hypothetical protein [Alphabaculovirus altersperidaniae]|uniref:Uncharacterized protein n=1 Tax=Spodoptera eridania nucleopolyhedrovirus TaxID=2315721 RepID=A0ABX6TPW9_9ABAC|nr:hypothetical protein QKS47_gp022 [Spodoptera eridania nucleopolyhedrovirus]QNV47778.1 hypothetical protein [Spodoptera eridania nucleopolyhedrovirus]
MLVIGTRLVSQKCPAKRPTYSSTVLIKDIFTTTLLYRSVSSLLYILHCNLIFIDLIFNSI